MDKLTSVDVNITEIKYDNATNSMLIDQSDRSRWTLPCKDVLSVAEHIEDVAPYFLCFFLDRLEGYAVLKRVKVFTVFVEHEGVLHLRKYDNLVKKIKAGRLKDGVVAKKALLVDDGGALIGSVGNEDEDTLLDIMRKAGMEVDVVKIGNKKPRLDHLKKTDVDEVVSLHALDLSDEELHVEKSKIEEESLVNGQVECLVSEQAASLSSEKVVSHVGEKGNSLANGNVKNLDDDSEENADVNSAVDEGTVEPVKCELIAAVETEKIKVDAFDRVEDVGPSASANGFVGDGVETKDEKGAEGDRVLERKRSRGLKNAEGDNRPVVDLSETSSASSKAWHWSYYLIPAALIAIIAISVHLFREKGQITDT